VIAALGLLRRHGAALLGVALLAGALYVVQRQVASLAWADVERAIAATPAKDLWFAALWTFCAFAVLTIYDKLGSVYAGHPVSLWRTSLASFCAYSLSNNIGLATVSGAAVRYRFYAAWGVPAGAIARIVAFTSLTFGLGAMTLGGAILVFEPEIVPALDTMPEWAVRAVGVALWAVVAGYLSAAVLLPHVTLFGYRIDLPRPRMALAQIVLASVDVAVTAMIFYVLLPDVPGLTFLAFLGVYLAAYSAGIAANTPGGIGVFDGAILLGLTQFMDAASVVGALLLFRAYYYLAPLVVAGVLFAGFEVAQRGHLIPALSRAQLAATSFEVPVAAGLTAIAGAGLIFLGALPPRPDPILWDLLGGGASHFAASVVGSLLLVASWGLLRRMAAAWGTALFLLLNGAAVLWLRGEPWWLTVAMLVVALLLAVFQNAFYRHVRLTREPLSAESLFPLAALVACALLLAAVGQEDAIEGRSWYEVVLAGDLPASVRFGVGLSGLLLLVAAAMLLRPAPVSPVPLDAAARQRFEALGGAAPGGAEKALFLDADRAALAYRPMPGVLLALGEPSGREPEARTTLLWRFRDLAERGGNDPAFLGVGDGMRRQFEDLGLTLFPLPDGPGGEARFLACRAERDFERLRALLPNAG
jgi:phosphatidylglycerol lysyltransferase